VRDGGLSPTLGAILPLVGVVLGALLSGGVQYALRRRDERAEVRAVTRILLNDLEGAVASLDAVLSDRLWNVLDTVDVRDDDWNKHDLLLARHLSDDDWDAVATAFRDGAIVGLLLEGEQDDEERVVHGRQLLAELRAGADVLRPLARA
jgi:hypothetical protein